MVALLDGEKPASFTPSLLTIDELIQSITINP